MEWVETTDATIEEAKSKALDQLGVAEDDAEFDVIDEPRRGCSVGCVAKLGCGRVCVPRSPGPSSIVAIARSAASRRVQQRRPTRLPTATKPTVPQRHHPAARALGGAEVGRAAAAAAAGAPRILAAMPAATTDRPPSATPRHQHPAGPRPPARIVIRHLVEHQPVSNNPSRNQGEHRGRTTGR